MHCLCSSTGRVQKKLLRFGDLLLLYTCWRYGPISASIVCFTPCVFFSMRSSADSEGVNLRGKDFALVMSSGKILSRIWSCAMNFGGSKGAWTPLDPVYVFSFLGMVTNCSRIF